MEEIVFCIISIWLKGWKNGKIENMSFLPLLVGQKKGRKEKLLYFKLPLYLYIIYFKFINEGKICYIFFSHSTSLLFSSRIRWVLVGPGGKHSPSPFSFVPIFLSYQAVKHSCSFSIFFPPSFILLLSDNQSWDENFKGRVPSAYRFTRETFLLKLN